jgi:hypothetical protein
MSQVVAIAFTPAPGSGSPTLWSTQMLTSSAPRNSKSAWHGWLLAHIFTRPIPEKFAATPLTTMEQGARNQ